MPVILLSDVGAVKADNGMDMNIDDYEEVMSMFYSIDCVTPKLFGNYGYNITEVISSGVEHVVNAPIEVVRTTLDLWRDISEMGGEVMLERTEKGGYVNKVCYIVGPNEEEEQQQQKQQ